MSFQARKRFGRPMVIATALIHLVTIGLLGVLPACSHPQSMNAAMPPSLLLAPTFGTTTATALDRDLDENACQLSTSSVFIDGQNTKTGSSRRRLADRILNKVAREIQKMQGQSLDDPFAYYRSNLLKFQDNYEYAEESAGTLGIDKTAFRQGLVIAAAASAAGLGTLNLIKPEGLTDYLFSTRFRVGYDVSHIDDPKMFFTYNDLFRVGGDRNGLYGSFRDKSGRLYSAQVNVIKMRAVLTLVF